VKTFQFSAITRLPAVANALHIEPEYKPTATTFSLIVQFKDKSKMEKMKGENSHNKIYFRCAIIEKIKFVVFYASNFFFVTLLFCVNLFVSIEEISFIFACVVEKFHYLHKIVTRNIY
jgi:hypothetical protein